MNKFIFHSVGQGLFYTGHIDNGLFNFAYDCGTVSGEKYIKHAISSLGSEKLVFDFVMLSHLHADHINGIYKLKEKHNIRKYYLPYLGSENVQLVKLLASSVFFDKSVEFDEEETEVEKTGNVFEWIINLYLRTSNEGEIEFIGKESSHSSKVVDSDFWRFNIINKRQPDKELEGLNKKIEEALTIHGVDDVSDLIESERLGELEKIYNEIFKKNNINLTSTVLIHYPVSTEYWVYENSRCYEYFWCPQCTKKCGTPITILTGDAMFDKEMLDKIDEVLSERNDTYKIFQVPHHGAKDNWKALKEFRFTFDHYVIPYGLGNGYRHPNSMVVNELSMFKVSAISSITQLNDFIYHIKKNNDKNT